MISVFIVNKVIWVHFVVKRGGLLFSLKIPIFLGIYILVDTYMRFLERGRELIAAQVVETSC